MAAMLVYHFRITSNNQTHEKLIKSKYEKVVSFADNRRFIYDRVP